MTKSGRTTRTLAGGATGRRGKLSTGILLLLGLFAGLIGFAPSAFAHHAYVKNDVRTECDVATGMIRVHYEVDSWGTVSSDQRVLNASIGIQHRFGSSSSFPEPTVPITGFSTDVANGAFVDNNSGGTPYFAGSYLIDASYGGQYIQLRAYPKATWVNASGTSTLPPNPEGDDSFGSSLEPLPTGCNPPDPSATATLQCGEGRIQLSLAGAGSATTVDIRKNGVLVGDDVAVPVGGPTLFDVPLADADENTTVAIALDYAAGTDQSFNVAVDCDSPAVPSADVQWACGSNATVVLGNTGQETIFATISKNGTPVFTDVPVPQGGATRSVAVGAADENTTVTISVTFSDPGTATDVTETFAVDCDRPAPTIGTPVCAEGGLLVALGNTAGTDAAVFSIVIDGTATTQTVAAGGTYSLLIPVAEDATVAVSISSGAVSYVNEALTRDCENPQATVGFDCAEGGVVVELTNSGELDATVDVNGEDVVVPAGTTAADPVVRVIPVAEGDSYDVTVLGQTASGTRDCESPLATVVFDCAEGGVVVTVTNDGDLPTEVMVNGQPVTVQPGDTYTTTVPVAEGDTYFVQVTGDDGLDEMASGQRDCEMPAVESVGFECAEGGVVVVLTNSGELDATVQVNGADVVVPAGGEATVTVPVAENAAYAFDIVVEGVVTSVTGTRDCEQPAVLSATLECAEGGVVVLLTNTGESDTTVNVNGIEVNVPAGTTADSPVSVTVPVGEGADYDIGVSGDQLDQRYTGQRECELPMISSVQLECAEGGVVVVLTNDGEQATTVLVDGVAAEVPAGAGSSDDLPAVRVTVPVAENGAFDFTVVGDGIEKSFTGVADCLLPEPSVDDEVVCAAGGLNLVLRNTGGDIATFVVSSPAVPDGQVEVTVGPGETVTQLLSLGEDTTTEVTVTSDGETLFDRTITRDCEDVAGVVVLPRTGADTAGLLSLAGVLLLAGAALVVGARRREASLLS